MKHASLSYFPKNRTEAPLVIPGSKSIANRLLILQAIFPEITLKNLPNSNDVLVLQKALASKEKFYNIHHSGTAMRFLTAYFATQKNTSVTLTGSNRMKQRPVGILVEALQSLGAKIQYQEKEGFPPLQITGTQLVKEHVSIKGSVSSQYITALMLIAPTLPKGLKIQITGKITSLPYILMTVRLLKEIGIACSFTGNTIAISPEKTISPITLTVESDWSSASYFYSFVALSKKNVRLKNFSKYSIQGDSKIISFFNSLGVKTIFEDKQSLLLQYEKNTIAKSLVLNLNNTPDLAQTIAVTCVGLQINCKLTGLETLPIKETNRLLALKTELEKLGAKVNTTTDSIEIQSPAKVNKNIAINTYQDHRMAMAFAPLAVLVPLTINNPTVVTKSFPSFWNKMRLLGINC